jgi:cyclopropane fatty-acyl-phospholipid synthase-like methyltransferase
VGAVDELALAKDKAQAYVGWPHLFDATNEHQFQVLIEQGLKPEHFLLDVGAGCLGVGLMLINYLEKKHYWAVEPNRWLIDASGASRRSFRCFGFKDFKLSRIEQKFDVVLAHSIFTHADRDQIKTILDEAYAVLNEGGLLAATFYDQGFGDSEHKGWMYPAGVAYTQDFICNLAIRADFSVETVPDKRHPAHHTWLFGRK